MRTTIEFLSNKRQRNIVVRKDWWIDLGLVGARKDWRRRRGKPDCRACVAPVPWSVFQDRSVGWVIFSSFFSVWPLPRTTAKLLLITDGGEKRGISTRLPSEAGSSSDGYVVRQLNELWPINGEALLSVAAGLSHPGLVGRPGRFMSQSRCLLYMCLYLGLPHHRSFPVSYPSWSAPNLCRCLLAPSVCWKPWQVFAENRWASFPGPGSGLCSTGRRRRGTEERRSRKRIRRRRQRRTASSTAYHHQLLFFLPPASHSFFLFSFCLLLVIEKQMNDEK